MKNLKLLFLIFSFFAINLTYAQTKKIAHKSHSGKMSTFEFALKHHTDITYSNFGAAPMPRVIGAVLDSLIFINDTTIVMVTSEACRNYNPNKKKQYPNAVWRQGTDTLRTHTIFTLQHHLDSIKKVIKEDYNFVNPVEKTTFIGYDNNLPKSKATPKRTKKIEKKTLKKENKKPKQKVKPTKKKKIYAQATVLQMENFPPKKASLTQLLWWIVGISVIMGLLTWKIKG